METEANVFFISYIFSSLVMSNEKNLLDYYACIFTFGDVITFNAILSVFFFSSANLLCSFEFIIKLLSSSLVSCSDRSFQFDKNTINNSTHSFFFKLENSNHLFY